MPATGSPCSLSSRAKQFTEGERFQHWCSAKMPIPSNQFPVFILLWLCPE